MTDDAHQAPAQSAPPKPAPDAVQWPYVSEDDPDVVLVAHAIAEHGIGRSWDDFLPCNAFDVDHGDLTEYARAAVAALRAKSAAPVPSPEGAGELTPAQIFIINDMIHAWIDDKKQYRRAFRDDCKRLLATLSPSPAVAAEPVAWTNDQIHFAARALALVNPAAYEDKTHKGSLRPNQKARDAALMALGAAVRYDSAIPPVRGDREIIRAFEDVCEKIAATRPQAAYLAMIDGGQGDLLTELDEVRRQARALLSLPVQPATRPDREAAAEIIAQRIYGSKLQDLEGVQMDNCRNIVTEICGLPAHSSSEGGR